MDSTGCFGKAEGGLCEGLMGTRLAHIVESRGPCETRPLEPIMSLLRCRGKFSIFYLNESMCPTSTPMVDEIGSPTLAVTHGGKDVEISLQ